MEPLSSFDCLDDLQAGGFRLWQNRRFFRFGTDGVLLADYARCRPGERMIDLCSGTGIVPFLLLARGEARAAEALEIQPYLCALMARSREENGCGERLRIFEADLREIRSVLPGNCYDLVTVNPPYEPVGRGIPGQSTRRNLARREIACTLEDVTGAAAYLLRPGGRLVMVHRPRRMAEVFLAMRDRKLAPARLRLVEPAAGAPAVLFLIEGIFCGKRELRVEPSLIMQGPDGSCTAEMNRIYRREQME